MSRKEKSSKPAPAQAAQEAVVQVETDPPHIDSPRVYVGPSVQRLGLSQYAIFQGGLPDSLQSAMANYPALAALFVPVTRLAWARAQLKDPTSALSVRRGQFISQLSK